MSTRPTKTITKTVKETTKEKVSIVRERRGTEVIESRLRAGMGNAEGGGGGGDGKGVSLLARLRLGLGLGGLGLERLEFGGGGGGGGGREVKERLTKLLVETFLPAGYPESVSPGTSPPRAVVELG